MNIVYASDDNFAEILGVSLTSLLESNFSCVEISVYVLDDGISAQNRENIELVAEKYGRTVTFIDVSGIEVPDSVVSARWSKSAFTRLYMKELLPENVNRILYLDCDIIVLKSLEAWYNTDLEGYSLAGVEDCVSKHYRRNIGLSDEDVYINSGVLLIDINKWSSTRMTEFLEKYGDVLKYPDQDVINGTFSSEIKVLPLSVNCYTAAFDFSYDDMLKFRKPSRYYEKAAAEECRSNPFIVHFTSSFLSLRPWIEGSSHPYAEKWAEYKSMTPWKDLLFRPDNRSGKKKLAVKIYRLLPKCVSLRLTGFLHAVAVPCMKRLKK